MTNGGRLARAERARYASAHKKPIRIAACASSTTTIRICQAKSAILASNAQSADSAQQFAGEVEQAVAAFDAAGDALADDCAIAREAGDRRLAPRRVVRMDDARGGAGLDFGAELDK